MLVVTALWVVAASFTAGCESDGGRVRQGIHDPIERHQRSFWSWPFRDRREPKPAPPKAPDENDFAPQIPPLEGVPPDL